MMDPNATDEALQLACVEGYNECMAEPATGGECTRPEGACTATVAEVEACLNDTLAVMNQLPSCEGLTAETLNGLEDPAYTEDPASCVAVDQECPGFT